jgi:hypothetical protein
MICIEPLQRAGFIWLHQAAIVDRIGGQDRVSLCCIGHGAI